MAANLIARAAVSDAFMVINTCDALQWELASMHGNLLYKQD